MESEGPRPGVERRREADVNAKVLLVASDLLQSLRRRLEEDVVAGLLVGVDERIELVRDGEDRVKVVRRQKPGESRLDPLGSLALLARRAVAVAGVASRLKSVVNASFLATHLAT